MGATETVARWIVETGYEDIPPDALRVAQESCFDCLGVMLAGAAQPVGRIIQKYVEEQGGRPEGTIIGSGIKTSLPNAALANGTMGHALDYDDFGGFGHPTVVLLTPLLALSEKTGGSGRDLLEAYVVGCEVGLALQRATSYHQMKRGFHGTAVIGRMAGAAACAKLLELDQRQTTTALGIAGTMASGVIHNFGTMTKPLHAGLTSRDGVMAAQLASMGLTSGDRILEHPVGFINSVMGEGNYDLDGMAENLGKPFHTQDALIIKKYPCCGGNHSLLDSILGLMHEHKFDYRDVESVEVDQSYLSVVMLYTEPEDELKAKFSAMYNTAVALVDGRVNIETFSDEKIGNSAIRETMDKVQLKVRSRWSQETDQFGLGMPVRIKLKDGRELVRVTSRDEILGSQQTPWGMDNIAEKFRVNAAYSLPPDMVGQAVETWSQIDGIPRVADAIKTLVADGG